MTSTSYCIQQQCSRYQFMNDLKTCMDDISGKFYSWLLFVKMVSQITDYNPKDICFAKGKGNLLNFFLYSLPLRKFYWYSVKEGMRPKLSWLATFSHTSLVLLNGKQTGDESLTSFIYKSGGLLLQSCGTSPEECREKRSLFLTRAMQR